MTASSTATPAEARALGLGRPRGPGRGRVAARDACRALAAQTYPAHGRHRRRQRVDRRVARAPHPGARRADASITSARGPRPRRARSSAALDASRRERGGLPPGAARRRRARSRARDAAGRGGRRHARRRSRRRRGREGRRLGRAAPAPRRRPVRRPLRPRRTRRCSRARSIRVSSTACSRCCASRRARCWSSRDAWRRGGAVRRADRRPHEDLDFCWRARVAGFRVLMTPLARVRHRARPPWRASRRRADITARATTRTAPPSRRC